MGSTSPMRSAIVTSGVASFSRFLSSHTITCRRFRLTAGVPRGSAGPDRRHLLAGEIQRRAFPARAVRCQGRELFHLMTLKPDDGIAQVSVPSHEKEGGDGG